MKYSITAKFLAFFLAALCMVSVFAGAVGIVAIEDSNLYVTSPENIQDTEYEKISKTIAGDFAKLYTAERLGNVPYALRQNQDLFPDPLKRSDADYWYLVMHQDGVTVAETGNPDALSHHAVAETYTLRNNKYPIVSKFSEDELKTEITVPDTPDASAPSPQIPAGYLYPDQETVFIGGKLETYYFYYYPAPDYTVTVYMQEQVLDSSDLHILTTLYPYRYSCIAVVVLGTVLFAAVMVYLMLCAGIHPDRTVQPAGLCRIPLDLYLLLALLGEVLLILLYVFTNRWVQSEGPHPGNLSLLATVLMAIALLGISPLYVLSAQFKVKNGYLWRHSALGWLVIHLWKGLCALYALLPVLWQWITGLILMGLSLLGLFLLAQTGNSLWRILFSVDLLVCGAIALYSGWCFAFVSRGMQRMCQGDLGYKIPTRHLKGNFLTLANSLNALSETAKTAAENEMRSERMRTELITNVSHDIKTPLTSIISFVDLLQKPHTSAQQEEYLDVLSRQSGRLKRLMEDLIELSKASSGSITVVPVPLDAVETVNQALGEFSDKLVKAQLTPVFQPEADSLFLLADGRLVWRVLSNLLSNAVKYSLPGTRLYIDLAEQENQVLLSLKNISAQPLTLEADDLLERFVRADAARHSEGSGLGLNITKSLMELQGGQIRLLLDGDLFKATLVFPKA